MTRKKLAASLAGSVIALIAVFCGVALATGVTVTLPFSDDGNTINGCYNPSNGNLRVLTQKAPTCRNGESSIQWNVTGPRGDTGETGQQGPAGIARAYAMVADYPWYTEPVLLSARSLNAESVVRLFTGTYCVYIDPSVGDPRDLVPVASLRGGSADPGYATVETCGPDDQGRRAIQVNLFDSGGSRINGGFDLIVP